MSNLSVEEYVAKQPSYTRRRQLMRGLLRQVGFRLLAKVEASGTENIPDSGPTILMMSHISALDPAICIGAVTNRFVIPMTKIENARNPIINLLMWGWGVYTVDRENVDRKALQNSIELLKSGQMILIAPEGTRSPEGLKEPKDGMVYIATKAEATIVPAGLSEVQHFISRWKTGRRAYAKLTFGRPFKFKTEGRKRIPRNELTQMTQEAMYQLAIAVPDPNLRGIYSDLSNATTDLIEFV